METTTNRRDTVHYVKRITGLILLLCLAAIFFYSAYTKSGVEFKGWRLVETPASSNAFDRFQWSFLDLGINSMVTAGVLARLMVGLELLLGAFLLFHLFLKKFTYKAVIAVLAVFIIYLLMLIWKQGNSGNCGCFGTAVTMTPLNAIWKNVAMIGVTVLLMYIYPVKGFGWYPEYGALIVGCASFCIPFLVNFIYIGTAPVPYKETPVDFSLMYKHEPAPPADLMKGKHLLSFMSLTCPHCKKAGYLLHVIHQQHPEIPMYIVLHGDEQWKKAFFEETHAEDVPHMFLDDSADFVTLSGPGVPAIYWINDGKVEFQSKQAYYQLDPKDMLEWLKNPNYKPRN